MSEVTYHLFKEERLPGAHHLLVAFELLLVLPSLDKFDVFSVFDLFVFIEGCLRLVGKARHPVFFVVFKLTLILLEEFDVDGGEHRLGLSGVTSDDLLDGDPLINLLEELHVLLKVDMSAPLMGDAEQKFLEEV